MVKNEITQKDIKARYPLPNAIPKGDILLSKMTLGNLKHLRDKAKRIMTSAEFPDESNHWKKIYGVCNDEIKKRLTYINKPVVQENGDEIKFRITDKDRNARTKHFSVKFGEPDISKGAGKVFLGDKWFANAVQCLPDWFPNHQWEWYVNKHTEAFRLKYNPAGERYYKTVQDMLDDLEIWYSTINKTVTENMNDNTGLKALIRQVIKEHVNEEELFSLFKRINPKSSLYPDTPFGDNLRNFSYIIMTKYGKTPEDCEFVINRYWRQSPDQAKRMVADVVRYIEEKNKK